MIEKVISTISNLLGQTKIPKGGRSEPQQDLPSNVLVHVRVPNDTAFPEPFQGTWHSSSGESEYEPVMTIVIYGNNAAYKDSSISFEHDYKLFSSLNKDVVSVELHLNDEDEDHDLRHEPRLFGLNDSGSIIIGSTEWAQEFHRQT